MKNRYIIITSLILSVSLFSCNNEFFSLDKEPQDMISNASVFKDEMLADANLAQIYAQTLFHYGEENSNEPVLWILDEGFGAVARGYATWQDPTSAPLRVIDESGAGVLDYWPYRNIRNANEFIQGVEASDFDESYKNQRISEARFIRAFMYFQMVKRFGGVPIITVPQESDDELFVSRNSEQEVYDFIATEMDAIAEKLQEDTEDGRVNKYTALALKSRAMLYAASVAEFGTIQLDGLLGIPSSEADSYWTKCYDASMEIVNSGKYGLFNKIPDDPAENFQQLFVEASDNPERIFVKVYDPEIGRGQSWNLGAVPNEFAVDWGSNYCPFLNIIDEFEYADGTPGKIDRDLINSDYHFSIDEVFGNRDPRFLATFFYPGSEWQGGIVHFHRRTVYQGVTYTSGTIGDDWPAAAPTRNYANTGFLTRKLMDESEIAPIRRSSDEDFIVFRYGEILLNIAEASFYLNKKDESLKYINMIRERAGMPLRTIITEDDIRHERTVELVFEDHRYWDLRRWRIAHLFLDGLRTKGLEYTYYYDEDKYDFILKNGDTGTRVFQQRHYYFPLGVNRIADNPNLIENPGY